ncbi:extracellular solute-binding protein [Prosthecomicrobium pneumaticum]|uniref:Microcin C transport system substrate-binding protein n=1 Tax=Prosthecomicrobium pneumaticum TaxID=81895 RepID=A0A7W9FM29_9HYPH|nr:extracellular solute-binding protein [Prosthecomicrobium pneumaticum]MBB5753184.1 microcin C transport system substrate-binding protein [Prosthecomicrobium pneumaticum]
MRAAFFAALLAIAALSPAAAQETPDGTRAEAAGTWRHATSLIGEPKYPAGFTQYDYVNPGAPKGGTLDQAVLGTYDSFNPYIVQATPAAGIGLLWDSLMEQATDQAGTSYGLIAEAMRYPADLSSVTFRLDPRARWHDGTPITVDDVIWSFDTLKKNYPFYAQYFANVTGGEKTGEREVTFRFSETGNRELPNIMGDLPVLPKHWWEGTDAKGEKRDVSRGTLEPPLGSGPYKIGAFSAGRSVEWVRVEDYWAKDHPLRVGRFNYDRIRYEYFRDDNAVWEAFKKGGISDYRRENRAQRWAEGYDFPAVLRGDVVKRTFVSGAGAPMQGFALNTRRPQLQDRRVRRAITLALDFEAMNKKLFFGLYQRTDSYFEGQDLAASGLPQGKELEILETVRDKVPPEVFTTPFTLPVYDTPAKLRDGLREASRLLAEAGWTQQNGRLVNGEGQPLTIEFLGDDASDERVTNPIIVNLRRLGIDAKLRIVDPIQFQRRADNYDFDATTVILPQSQSPGNEQRDFFGSAAAERPGSRNLMGIRDPAVDALIDRVIFAKDRAELEAATHALDRVLLWNFYVVPHWNNPDMWFALWAKIKVPEKQPAYVGVDPFSWWIDTAREKAAGAQP